MGWECWFGRGVAVHSLTHDGSDAAWLCLPLLDAHPSQSIQLLLPLHSPSPTRIGRIQVCGEGCAMFYSLEQSVPCAIGCHQTLRLNSCLMRPVAHFLPTNGGKNEGEQGKTSVQGLKSVVRRVQRGR